MNEIIGICSNIGCGMAFVGVDENFVVWFWHSSHRVEKCIMYLIPFLVLASFALYFKRFKLTGRIVTQYSQGVFSWLIICLNKY